MADRTQPATFHAVDAAGRRWKVRVTPLGLECVTHEAEPYQIGRGTEHEFTAYGGQERVTMAWRDLLPVPK